MKTFDDVDVSKLSENEYILFQISKTKRFDYELVAEEAARQGRLEGIEEELAKIILRLLDKKFTHLQVSELLDLSLERVEEILEKYLPKDSE